MIHIANNFTIFHRSLNSITYTLFIYDFIKNFKTRTESRKVKLNMTINVENEMKRKIIFDSFSNRRACNSENDCAMIKKAKGCVWIFYSFSFNGAGVLCLGGCGGGEEKAKRWMGLWAWVCESGHGSRRNHHAASLHITSLMCFFFM